MAVYVIHFDFAFYNLTCRVIGKEVWSSAYVVVDVSMNAKLGHGLKHGFCLKLLFIRCI